VRSPSFSGRREVVIGLGVYGIYLAVRQAVYNERGRARAARNAERLVELERRLRVDVEPAVQRACVDRRRLITGLNAGYMSLNILLTVGSLMRLYFRRHPDFHRFRRAAALATLGAQPAFLFFPTAPPRTLDGFTDTIRELAGFDLDSGFVSRLYDPVAAMPSIHCAYAVVTSAAVAETSSSRVVKTAARLYPPAVAATVLATANHYVLDTVAGSALGLLSVKLAGRRFRP
jgi:membrane-associated phospholipid phosphatase